MFSIMQRIANHARDSCNDENMLERIRGSLDQTNAVRCESALSKLFGSRNPPDAIDVRAPRELQKHLRNP